MFGEFTTIFVEVLFEKKLGGVNSGQEKMKNKFVYNQKIEEICLGINLSVKFQHVMSKWFLYIQLTTKTSRLCNISKCPSFEERYLSLEVQSSSSTVLPNHHWTIASFLNCKSKDKKNLNHFSELWIAMNNIPAKGSGQKKIQHQHKIQRSQELVSVQSCKKQDRKWSEAYCTPEN